MTATVECSIVIPVYGSGGALDAIVQRCDAAFAQQGLSAAEFVFVDDNWPGDAWSVISGICAGRPLLQAILRYDLNFTVIDGLLAWNTQRIEMVSVRHH